MPANKTAFVIERYYRSGTTFYLSNGPDIEPHWTPISSEATKFSNSQAARKQLDRVSKSLTGAWAVRTITLMQ